MGGHVPTVSTVPKDGLSAYSAPKLTTTVKLMRPKVWFKTKNVIKKIMHSRVQTGFCMAKITKLGMVKT